MDVDPASVQFVLQDETLRRDTTVAAKGISINDVTHSMRGGNVVLIGCVSGTGTEVKGGPKM